MYLDIRVRKRSAGELAVEAGSLLGPHCDGGNFRGNLAEVKHARVQIADG